MANPPRIRKRVCGLRRAPDGSAFQKCDYCGVSVAVALLDMHDCKLDKGCKRFKGEERNQCLERGQKKLKCKDLNEQSLGKDNFCNQPRSAFCFFMENFKNSHKNEHWRDVEQKGFEKWKCMPMKERLDFIAQAEKVNLAYEKVLLDEVDYASEVDDEVDSAVVGKIDLNYGRWDSSDISGSSSWEIFESFDNLDWNIGHQWIY